MQNIIPGPVILSEFDFSVSNDDLSICLRIANQIPIPCRCADYVKHLMELTEAKEAAVEKAKSDLEEKKQERRERRKKEKAEEGDTEVDPKAKDDADADMQESDHESETSSLTAFSSGEGAEDGKEGSARRSKRTRATGTSSPSDDVDADGGKKIKSNDRRRTARHPFRRPRRRKFVCQQAETRAVVPRATRFLRMNLGLVGGTSPWTK